MSSTVQGGGKRRSVTSPLYANG